MGTLAITNTQVRIDKKSLAGIYEQHSPGIYRYAYRLLGDQDMAEECVAETFSRFLKALRNGQQPDNVQAYLYRMAHNWVTDYYRRQPPADHLDEDLAAAPASNPDHEVAQRMDQERVRHALQRLSPEQRLVISLRFLEERSHEEVALVLGKTVEATRALQHRAIAALRQMLLQQED
jgi:RNA polymerase sigma-70 factor (ECF subfamily)